MQPFKKHDLYQTLAEIEDDMAAEAADLDQQTDISQAVITELVIRNTRKKKDQNG